MSDDSLLIKRLIFFVAVALVMSGLFVVIGFNNLDQNRQKVQLAEEIEQTVTPTPTPPPTLSPIPTAHTIAGGNHMFQTFNNCGPASLSMTLSLLGIQETQQTLGQQLRPYQNAAGNNDDKSVTLAEVATKAKEYGFRTYLRPAGTVELLQQFTAHDIPVVARTWLEPGEDIGHFRVIKGYNQAEEVIIQDDSLQGANLKYGYDEFNLLWQAFNYEFLVLVPPEKQQLAEQILGPLANEQTAWETALATAEAQYRGNPNEIYAGFNTAVANYHLGRYQEAVTAYEQVQGRLPFRMLWYQLEPILAYYQVGNHNKVLQMSQTILNNHNRAYSELYYLQGLIYQQRGQADLATQNFTQADQYNNTSDIWLVNLTPIVTR